jgi:hypothetical protein
MLRSLGHPVTGAGSQPGEPTATATSTTSGQVDVVVDGDAGVTNRLFYRQADDTAWTTGVTRSGDGTIAQTGLTAGDIYTFVVVSDDNGYYSKPSKPLSLAVFGSTDHTYNILAVIEPAERGEYVEILCVEVK